MKWRIYRRPSDFAKIYDNNHDRKRASHKIHSLWYAHAKQFVR